ncbi:Tigger transposable element-derived protein 6 [Eumeta japonica]|uniref:Tigger transposable element-derived protein 6 n=1 Tax=Eumeta variegata TaxID=151549 RepID=A0A4C1U6S9_EUMVA|nr:Tigger transposable element-derived protein 6 [Eumeta japonica]
MPTENKRILETHKLHCKKLNYDTKNIELALKEIKEGNIKIREASKKYKIPRSTIQDRIHKRAKPNVRLGRTSVLSREEEMEIENWLIKLAKCGFPRKKDDLLDTVQNIIKEDQRRTPFVNQRPGRRWYEGFMRRHPILNERVPEGISKSRAIVSEQQIRKWFQELKTYLKSINCEDILQDPTRILNGDETSFQICPKTGKVIAPKGWKNCYDIKPGSEKETLTVLLVFSAAGDTVPPMVVFPYIRPPREVIESMPLDWFLGRSDTGWMKSDIFFEYIANGVNNWLTEKQIQKPVLLLVDGHRSHLTMELSEFCDNNKIILYSLPANATHILQPADVSVFRPLKVEWRKVVKEWQNREENLNKQLTKATFCPLLDQILKRI